MNTETVNIIIGLGETGFSCAQYLLKNQRPFVVMDTRDNPPYLNALKKLAPDVTVITGDLDPQYLQKTNEIILSPGLSPDHPELKKCSERGVKFIGDIELFARNNTKPVIAITGTNGKSTVTSLVGAMCQEAGLNTIIAGNIGVPVLNTVANADYDIIVLELSSYQLETTYSLKKRAATVLNIAPDHLERHKTFENYAKAKMRIYDNCEHCIVNRNEDNVIKFLTIKNYETIATQSPRSDELGIIDNQYLGFGSQKLIALTELPLQGAHHFSNYVAALALGKAAGLPVESMLNTLRHFKGLHHRCEIVRHHQGVVWINDSKGTNIHATVAALTTLAEKGPIILIAGGIAKDNDFAPLISAVKSSVKQLVVLGQAAPLLADTFCDIVPVHEVKDMGEAVRKANALSRAGDIVLLSPACASFDMFQNFEHRGQVFQSEVNALT